MRVAAYWKTGTPWLGGWNYFLNMARVCRTYAPDIQFVLVNNGGLEQRKRDDLLTAGIELLEAPPRPKAYHLGLLGIRDAAFETALRAARIDVVFELVTFHGARFSLPALSWIPDFQHRLMPRFFSRGERFKRDLDHGARLRHRRHVMLSSQAARQDLLAFNPKPRATIQVVPFAVRPVLTVTQNQIAKTLACYGIAQPYFFLPNQFWQHKNHLAAIEAVAQAPNARLVLSGDALDPRDGGHGARLAQRIADLGLTDRVHTLGVISYPDLLNLIGAAHALVNPSLFEGWSTTVEEAKSLGTPVLLSSLAVHREQAPDALFFDPRQPGELAALMTRLLQEPAEDFTTRHTRAVLASDEAQEIYARKLKAALEATRAG